VASPFCKVILSILGGHFGFGEAILRGRISRDSSLHSPAGFSLADIFHDILQ
jgi:hypothetical protein